MTATRGEINALAAELRAGFERHGAQAVEPPILQSAETLLDLYGEDIRARAYVTSDALRGEQMLRPDFTVPVVQMHMAHGADPARYTYAGEVFRRQEHDAERPNEFVQVGYEVFERDDPAASDAEVFALIAEGLGELPVRAVTGDIGMLMAVVNGLNTSDLRKTALMRHIWRPRRFRALLERFATDRGVPEFAVSDAPLVGARRQHEIDARIEALRSDAEVPPISARDVDLIAALLNISAPMTDALERLHDLSVDLPAIVPAVAQVAARQDALAGRGVDVGKLTFDASYGRKSMEYYDGFVFGFHAAPLIELPPLASGGRYDALTRRLGARLGDNREIPAVGGVMRPDLMLGLGAQI